MARAGARTASKTALLPWPCEHRSQAAAARVLGRMQDNEPLMRALSSLIVKNEPDLVLFVGEALVGNDAVDQLTKFNRRLTDLARNQARRAVALARLFGSA